jgi:hypothetical protein
MSPGPKNRPASCLEQFECRQRSRTPATASPRPGTPFGEPHSLVRPSPTSPCYSRQVRPPRLAAAFVSRQICNFIIGASGFNALVDLAWSTRLNSIFDKTKPPGFAGRFCGAKAVVLFAVAEASRPPSGAARLSIFRWFGRGLNRGRACCRFRLAASDGRHWCRLGVDQEAHLFAHG